MADRSSWSHYATIDSDNTKVSGTSTEVVVEIDCSQFDSTWWSNVKSDGTDIVIVPSGDTTDANKLARELVGFDTGTSSGIIHFGPVTLTSASSTSFDVWVGNASASETEDLTTLWADCVHVFHLEEDPSGSSPQVVDSAGTQDGTSQGSMTSGDLITAKLGSGLDFDGADDYIDVGTAPITGSDNRTMMCWYKGTRHSNADTFMGWGDSSGSGSGCRFYADRSQSILGCARVEINGGALIGTTALTDGSWHYIVATLNGTTMGDFHIYVDGGTEESYQFSGNSTTVNTSSTTNFMVANGGAFTDRELQGTLDEVRIYNVALSTDQIATMYESQNDPTAFWTYNTTTAVGGGGGTADQVDSFEDGDYTTDPTWSDDSDVDASATIGSSALIAYDGTEYLQLSVDSSAPAGTTAGITHSRPTADAAPSDGDEWTAYQRHDTGFIHRYRLTDSSSNYVELQYNEDTDTLTITDGTNTETSSSATPTIGDWYGFVISFGASSAVSARMIDSTDTEEDSTATITHSLTDISSVAVNSEIINQAGGNGENTRWDYIKYGQSGASGYSNTINGVAGADIGKVNGASNADIGKVNDS